MDQQPFLWVLLPLFIAAGSALVSYSIMQARMEAAIARERVFLAEARASINTHEIVLDARLRAAEETAKRKALNEFMQEFRVEERRYPRDHNSPANLRKIMVMQERLYFRNIPLSNWVEHEMILEDTSPALSGAVANQSIFNTAVLHQDTSEECAFSGRLLS